MRRGQFLGWSTFAAMSPAALLFAYRARAAIPMSDAQRIFSDEFVPNIEGSVYYPKWARSSPTDAARWVAFRDALLRGETPDPPVMSTKFGKALAAAGKEHMSISQLLGQVTNPYPPPVPPPTPPPSGDWFPSTWYSGPSDNAMFKLAMPPTQGVYVGIWRNPAADIAGMHTRETQSGRTFDIGAVSYYDGALPNANTVANQYVAEGKIPLIDAGHYNCSSSVGMSQLIDSTARDAFILDFLTQASAKNPNGPVIIRQFHEWAGTWFLQHWYTITAGVPLNSQPAANACTADQFIRMHRKPVDIARNAGLTNLLFGWCPRPYPSVTAGTYPFVFSAYPGDDYVDIIMHNAYGLSDSFSFYCGNPAWWQAWQLWKADDLGTGCSSMYSQYPDKPYMITETGADAVMTGTHKQEWIQNIAQGVQDHLSPRMVGMIYSDYVGGGGDDNRLDSPASALTGWTTLVNDAYFNTRNR